MVSPEVGKYVVVRSRPAVIREVKTFSDGNSQHLMHTVDVDYLDGLESPADDRLVWEREIRPQLLPVLDLPDVFSPRFTLDEPERFHAFLDALNWSSNCLATWDGQEVEYSTIPLLSPWYSSVQVEDYQLLPVLQAMMMPRVNMLLADDVGLGKTIEAGLIMQELIRQRRIKRIAIVCPASLQIQWQDEMKEKFNLDFKILDSNEVYRTMREMGTDSNPWLENPRIITSMDYLKQRDILTKFLHASRTMRPKDSAMLPWDLLIVDEAHNFSPAWLRDVSDRSVMLKEIVPYFEHRLFLTATPHNGYTLSFTGLLELLDPVRFQQKTALDEEDIRQLSLIMVRRMKEELNEGREQPRFSQREVKGIPIELTDSEEALYKDLRDYHELVRNEFKGKRERVLCEFIFSMLRKRLLSSVYSFSRTWWNHVEGFNLEGFGLDQALESKKRAEAETIEDQERDRREEDVSRHGAAWMKERYPKFKFAINRVCKTLESMGWSRSNSRDELSKIRDFPHDTKFESMCSWIDNNLGNPIDPRTEERVIIFTEYKDTLDYLEHRLRNKGWDEPRVQKLFGGIPSEQRRKVKEEFNEPESQLRILIATDAASEGLNLQTSCRYILHHELPWSPTRLEQRNGRVDRHGQYRDVTVHHYVSDQLEDLHFLDFVARKVHNVRHDLGSMGRVLDEAVTDFFNGRMGKEELKERLDKTEKYRQDRSDLSHSAPLGVDKLQTAIQQYETTKDLLHLEEERLVRLLIQAVGMDKGAIEVFDGEARFRTVPPSWDKIVKKSLLLAKENNAQPKMVFSPSRLEEKVNGMVRFQQKRDVRLITLSHPLMNRAISAFRRKLWSPSSESGLSRITMESSKLPDNHGMIAVISFTILARNRLGERFREGMANMAIGQDENGWVVLSNEYDWSKIEGVRINDPQSKMQFVRSQWNRLSEFTNRERGKLTESLQIKFEEELSSEWVKSEAELKRLYKQRKDALRLDRTKYIEKLKSEFSKAEENAKQMTFSEDINAERRRHYEEMRSRLSEAHWESERQNIEDMVKKLESDEKRMIEKVLPSRHTLGEDGVLIQVAAVRLLIQEVV